VGVGVKWWSRGQGREVGSEKVERGELKETKEETQESAPSPRGDSSKIIGTEN
jgi:hypothetical protein